MRTAHRPSHPSPLLPGLLLGLLAIAACERPASTGAPSAAAAPAVAAPSAAPAAAPAAAPPVWPAAGPEWATVALAEGAAREAPEGSVPGTFRNAAGAVACPVMGMDIATPADAVSFADHAGVRYFFCCDSCEKLFLDNPEEYANGKYMNEHALDRSAPAACEEEAGKAG
jgi:YHS domain-containing protein